jgi:60S ribosomal subunit assembly/export protein LOC1
LNIPKLNMVTPVGVQPPKGKKKGKIFIDDKVRGSCFIVRGPNYYCLADILFCRYRKA